MKQRDAFAARRPSPTFAPGRRRPCRTHPHLGWTTCTVRFPQVAPYLECPHCQLRCRPLHAFRFSLNSKMMGSYMSHKANGGCVCRRGNIWACTGQRDSICDRRGRGGVGRAERGQLGRALPARRNLRGSGLIRASGLQPRRAGCAPGYPPSACAGGCAGQRRRQPARGSLG